VPDKASHVETPLKQEFDGVTSHETSTTSNEDCPDSDFLSKSNGFVDFLSLLKYIQKSFD
jgi:hypothetical protein